MVRPLRISIRVYFFITIFSFSILMGILSGSLQRTPWTDAQHPDPPEDSMNRSNHN